MDKKLIPPVCFSKRLVSRPHHGWGDMCVTQDGGTTPGSDNCQGAERLGGGCPVGGRRHRIRGDRTCVARQKHRAESAVPRRHLGEGEGLSPRRCWPNRAAYFRELRFGGVGPPPRHVEGDNHQDGGSDPEGQAGQGDPPEFFHPGRKDQGHGQIPWPAEDLFLLWGNRPRKEDCPTHDKTTYAQAVADPPTGTEAAANPSNEVVVPPPPPPQRPRTPRRRRLTAIWRQERKGEKEGRKRRREER